MIVTEQFFAVILFIILYMVIVWVCGKNLKCDYTNESYWAVLPCVNFVIQGDSSNKCPLYGA